MNNIILIGMPGVGKSTLGKMLAQKINSPYLDTDHIIIEKIGMPLAQYISSNGIEKFKEIESSILLSINVDNCVISTGGSVVYMNDVMQHLKKIGSIIYIENNFQTIKKRILNAPDRGLVIKPGQTLKDLYLERIVLYKQYADLIVNCENLSAKKSIEKIFDLVNLK